MGVRHLFRRRRRRKPDEPHEWPQGEEYEALKNERAWQENREAFAENMIRKVGHKNLPFLDDPFD